MSDKKLKIITEKEAENRSVIRLTADNPMFIGTGENDYLCGECDKVLLKSMLSPLPVQNIVIGCYSCGKLNDVP